MFVSRSFMPDLMASHLSIEASDSLALNLQRIEIATYGIHSMMSMLLMAGGSALPAYMQHRELNVPTRESGSCAPDLTTSVQSTNVTSSSKLRRMRARATRNRLWHASQHSTNSTTAEASTSTQQLGSLAEELVPLSRVEQLLEASAERMQVNY